MIDPDLHIPENILPTPPFSYVRMADLNEEGMPLTETGEATREWQGNWYITDEEILLH